MVTICQQCGDKGFANALVYCVKCLDFAVHRYCLDKLPESFDEFVHWLCEDCKPKTAKQFPLDKPSSIPSRMRDHMNLNDAQVTHCRLKSKKKVVCSVAETEEQRRRSSPSQQARESHTKLDLTNYAQLVDYCSPVRLKLKKKEVICSVAETEEQRRQISPSQQPCESHIAETQEQRHQSSPSQQPRESHIAETEERRRRSSPSRQPRETHTKLDLTNYAQLVDYCSPVRIKLKKKKEQIHQSIPSQQPPESHTKHNLNMCAWSVGDCSPQKAKLKKKKKKMKKKKGDTHSVAETEEQRHESGSSQQPCEEHTKLYLTERSQLALDCSPLKIKLKRNKDDVTPSVAETGEQKCQYSFSPHPYEAHTKVKVPDCAPWAGNCSPLIEKRSIPQCSENHGNDLKLGKQRSSILEEGSKSGEVAECARIDSSQTGPGDLSNILEHNSHLHAQPVIDPTWRGSFSICDRKYDGVIAHLSSKACSKVFKEASLLPALLCLEMLPKTDVWPKSFERSEPRDDNIAMYFFPGSKSCERVFDCLVDDMIHQELAMRAMVKNAELLIFTSTELPLLYWKFQGKHYLWGVFREKQASFSNPSNHHLMVQNNSNESIVYLNSANEVGTGQERSSAKTKTWGARSPLSPLSNSDSYGSGSL